MDGGPCSPCCSEDPKKKAEWENEIVHPTIDAYGSLAKALKIDKMVAGVEYEATIRVRLKSGNFDEKAGVTSASLAVVAASDWESDEADPVVKAMRKRSRST